MGEAANILGKVNPRPQLKKLADEDFIAFFEEVVDRFRPKKVRKVRFTEQFNDPDTIQLLFEEIEKKEKQLEALMLYLKEVPVLEHPDRNAEGIVNADFIKMGASQSSVNTLVKNGVFEYFEERISRFPSVQGGDRRFELTENQNEALQEIRSQWEEKDVVLLHGITGSGKTEIYIKLIEEVIAEGRECLYLLPEIALTTHIVERLRKSFGDDIGVFHSKFSDNERVEIWENMLKGRYKLVVGVRSSLFLPFRDLGLVIVDEEHDYSFKQHDPAPRYHAREAGIILAGLFGGKVLLGSATPAMESYFLSEAGKWGRVDLLKRFHKDAVLPKLELQDELVAHKKGLMQSIFTKDSIEAIEKTLEDKNQAIIFQNRRGYSPYLMCRRCGYIPMCHQCDVSLTLHQYDRQLRCHYCGFYEEPPSRCPRCNHTRFQTMGTGTEKIEEVAELFFPDAGIRRMDLDTTRGKYAHQSILDAFDKQNIDILIGTQMVTKGLDFDHVELVLVIGVDKLLFFPDFRSNERTFQVITQVSGRAGRKSRHGRVLVQTNNTDHPIFKFISENDYRGFYEWELAERNRFHYPPFTRIIKVSLRSRDEQSLIWDSQQLSVLLKGAFGKRRVLGPEKPPVAFIRKQHIREFYLKYERDNISPAAFKDKLQEILDTFETEAEAPNLRLIVDVDPI
jgi:primosomal protein N' (replication factor Y)